MKINKITIDTTDLQRITRGYCEQMHANTPDDLEDVGTFLETHNLPRPNQEETEPLRRPIMCWAAPACTCPG